MELKTVQTIDTDVLVIGGGGAGLRAAIEARKYGLDVLLVSESRVGFGNNTAISGATFAATGIWKEPGDSPEVHFRDTIIAGRLVNDRKLVEIMTRGATQQVYDLMSFGVNFEKQDRDLQVWHLPGHTYPRHVSGERRGISLTKPMREYAANIGIQFEEGILITKLLRTRDMVVGALGINDKGQVFVFNAKATILATGGAGELYLRTDNAVGSTGDGYALAYEIGACLRDMEFVQFYPTNLGKNKGKNFVYEVFVVRGAVIRNSLGENILEKYEIKDFASMTKDIVSRAVMTEIAEGRGIEGNVVVDFTSMTEEEYQRVPRRFTQGRAYPEEVRVAPTAQSFMGGIKISENGETGIKGLYAAGEVCGGIHGANRLGGNAITETLVFGTIAGDRAAARASKTDQISASQGEIAAEVGRLTELTSGSGRGNLDQLRQSLRQTMWDKVGVVRNGKSLGNAQREILALREQLGTVPLTDYRQFYQAIKLANMLTVADMVCRAALTRTESRGVHHRTDYPEENNEQWRKTIELSRQGGEMMLRVIPINGNTIN